MPVQVNRVLFAMEKFCDSNPACGVTNSESMLVGAVMSTGLVGESKRFYFDILCQQLGPRRMSELLLEDLAVFQPDLVIYSTLGGLLGFQLNPPNEALNEIRRRGVKLYTCLWDTVGIDAEIKWRWLPFSDRIGIIDSVATPARFGDDPRVIQSYSAIDPNDFCRRNLERDIDVCFVGGIDPTRWPFRTWYMNFIRDSGINIVVRGGQRESRLSWGDYSGFLNRSKISFNLATDPRNGKSQCKGRVFESMACGAMLIENDTDQTKALFEPGKDFVTFGSPEDLVGKIKYYLAHDGERQAIAQSGYEKVTKLYNARNLWGYIFEKVGFSPPEGLAGDGNYLLHREILDSVRRGDAREKG